ncbi:MAG TPA: MBL fold metallo-hydrolase [Patescibacteria group bacterium]|nr:MBL fold metallo-hydrolase [Patescibacteria group bacterium]
MRRLIILVIIFCLVWVGYQQEMNRQGVVFLAVGQGDSTLILLPQGLEILVDCGPDATVISRLGRYLPFFVQEIDYLFITHADLDHYGGCEEVLRRFEVKNIVLDPRQTSLAPAWQSLQRALTAEGVRVITDTKEAQWVFSAGRLQFFFITPDKIDANTTSLVFQLIFPRFRILFMADLGQAEEKKLQEKYGEILRSDILKVGHHGSAYSSEEGFLKTVGPAQAVIMVGKNNFGHPSVRVLKRLERQGAEIWQTDEEGDIIVTIKRDRYEIQKK